MALTQFQIKVDIDKSGAIEFNEFVTLMTASSNFTPQQELIMAFKTFDKVT